MKRIRIAIAGLTACSGCQLTLLDCESELPELLEHVSFDCFPLACSPSLLVGSYDAALVEGCVSMPAERAFLRALRLRSRRLVALGSCAAWGGVAAMRNGEPREQLRRMVYGEAATAAATDEPLPLKAVVPVEAAVTGCPPEKQELLALLGALLQGTLPVAPTFPVCADCRARENLCLLTERSMLCLGLLTLGGCGARCPSMGVPCEGCRGPAVEANLAEALLVYGEKGWDRASVMDGLRCFCQGWDDEEQS